MKKILLCLCLLAGYGMAKDNTVKDKDGVFLGFEVGISELKKRTSSAGSNVNKSFSSPMYGFRAGYKHFFNDYVGVAGYVSFRDSFASVRSSDGGDTNVHFMRPTINVDALLDFYSIQNISLGALAGISIGEALFNQRNAGESNIWGFYSDIRVGLSANIENSQISLIASFPVVSMRDHTNGVRTIVQSNYAISMAYDYRF